MSAERRRIDGDRIDDYRSVLDGVAFTERLGLEVLARLGVPRGRHRLAGGATRSDVWNQIRADVLASPVLVPADPTSGRGAAILAAAASATTGWRPWWPTWRRWPARSNRTRLPPASSASAT